MWNKGTGTGFIGYRAEDRTMGLEAGNWDRKGSSLTANVASDSRARGPRSFTAIQCVSSGL